jgi:hypothetical protein
VVLAAVQVAKGDVQQLEQLLPQVRNSRQHLTGATAHASQQTAVAAAAFTLTSCAWCSICKRNLGLRLVFHVCSSRRHAATAARWH